MKTKIVIEIFIGLLNCMSTSAFGIGQKTWTYELKEVTASSSDTAKVNIDLNVERVSRGVYAFSGEILVDIDVVEGDSTNIQAKSFRKRNGDADYRILPFQMPNTHVYKVLNTYYKDIIMNTLKECSNLPVFDDKFQPPLEKKLYKLEACQFSQDGFPNHVQEGVYKLFILGSGEVEWHLNITSEVISDF